MSCTVEKSANAAPASSVEGTNEADDAQRAAEERQASYEETKQALQAMDEALQQAQAADPGNPDIKKARKDLKKLDKAVDDVFDTTEALEEAKKGGDPAEIEDALNDAIDAQMNFGEQYERASASQENVTGVPLPPLAN